MNIKHVLALTAFIIGGAGSTYAGSIDHQTYHKPPNPREGAASLLWLTGAPEPSHQNDGDDENGYMEPSVDTLISENRLVRSNEKRHLSLGTKRASIVPADNDLYDQGQQQLASDYDITPKALNIPEPASLALLALGFLLLALRLRKKPLSIPWCEPSARKKQSRTRYATARMLRTDRHNNMLAFKYFHQRMHKPLSRHRVKPINV